MKKQFNITRVYSDETGESHFEAMQMPLTDSGPIGYLSAALPVKEIIFREVEPTYDYDFHIAPRRQYVLLLDGGIEIETSTGDTRNFAAGEVILVEDTTGKGHRTRNLEPKIRRSVFIGF
jgi:hypothetical protein